MSARIPEVRRAVIPAGGQGTRMRPLSQAVPKEMFPVGLRPMLDHTVREAAASGIERVCIVLAPEKEEVVRTYFQAVPPKGCALEYAIQPEPLGLMDAVRQARSFVEDRRFAVLLPDNLFLGRPALAQLLEVPAPEGCHVIGLVRVRGSEAEGLGARGELSLAPIDGDDGMYRVHAIGPEKRPVVLNRDDTETWVNVGRYLFDPRIFPGIEATAATLGAGELDDLPVLNDFGARGQLLGRVVEGEYFDIGNPIGYWRANRRLGPGD